MEFNYTSSLIDKKSSGGDSIEDRINRLDDDITMLILKYNGFKTEEYSYKTPATRENYKEFNKWLVNICDKFKLNDSLKYKLELIAEELYTNVCFYAYEENESGEITVKFDIQNNDVILRFIDRGTPYNHLEKPDPDLNMSPENRDKGGLGIYIVKQYADDIEYEHKNNENILTIKIKNV